MPITTQSIKDANESELETMQQQLQQLQENISAQLRTRNGDNDSARAPSRTLDDKPAAVSQSSKQHIEVSGKTGDDAEPTTVEDRAIASDPRTEELVAANDDENPTESAECPVNQNEVSHKGSTASSNPQLSDTNGHAPSSNGEETVTDNALARDPMVKSTVDKAVVDQAVDAALTPPADMTKDGDDLSSKLTAVKPTSNGAATPETIIADPATSPPEADAMDLDGI